MAQDPNYQFVHSTSMDFGDDGYVMVINEKNVNTDVSRLRIVKNPMRPFWVTKAPYQNHKEKKEFAKNSELDMYICPQNELKYELAKALNLYKGRNAWYDIRKMCDSPYVYGADVDPEVVLRIGYMKNCKPVAKYNVGFLDIETSVFGDGRINVLSYVDQNFVIHTAILKDFMQGKTIQDIETYRESVWMKQFIDPINHDAKKAILKNHQEALANMSDAIKAEYEKWDKDKKGDPKDYSKEFNDYLQNALHSFFKFDLKICEREAEALIFIFKHIHRTKPDFIGIWNMDYDIPYLIERLEKLGIPPQHAFSHPEVPAKLRFCKYKKDPGKPGQHFTDKWHWLYAPGYTKYIDSMCLYSRIRKVDGRDNSYKLDYIANKEIGVGKMPVTTHEDMQEHHFIEYVVYNTVDVAVLVVMELVNHDMDSLMGLTYISPLHQFAHQTKMLTNNFYEYCRDHGLVSAAVGKSQRKPTDDIIFNVGGAVLEPTNIRDASLPVLEENEDLTQLYTLVCDIDVSSTWGSYTGNCVVKTSGLTAGSL